MVQIIVPDLEPEKLPNIGAVIDGGGVELTTGDKRAPVTVARDCTITGWRVVGSHPGEVAVDIYLAPDLIAYPPGAADSIVGATPPTVTGTVLSAEGSDVSDWANSAQLSAGNILEFAILSVSGFRWVRIELFIEAR